MSVPHNNKQEREEEREGRKGKGKKQRGEIAATTKREIERFVVATKTTAATTTQERNREVVRVDKQVAVAAIVSCRDDDLCRFRKKRHGASWKTKE